MKAVSLYSVWVEIPMDTQSSKLAEGTKRYSSEIGASFEPTPDDISNVVDAPKKSEEALIVVGLAGFVYLEQLASYKCY